MSPDITGTSEWQALVAHANKIRASHLRDLFAADPQRGTRLTAQMGDLYVDYSKNLVTDEVLTALVALAERAGLRERIDAMFRGEHVNVTEDRAVLHVALRAPASTELVVDGQDVSRDVHEVLERMAGFAERVRSGD